MTYATPSRVALHLVAIALACAGARVGLAAEVELTRSDLPEGSFTSATLAVYGYKLGGEAGQGDKLGVVQATTGLVLHVDGRGLVQLIEVEPEFSERFQDGRLRDLLQNFAVDRMRALLGVEDPPDAEAPERSDLKRKLTGLGVDIGSLYKYSRFGVSFIAERGKATLMIFPAAARR